MHLNLPKHMVSSSVIIILKNLGMCMKAEQNLNSSGKHNNKISFVLFLLQEVLEVMEKTFPYIRIYF